MEKTCQNKMSHGNQEIVSLADQSRIVSTAVSFNKFVPNETQESTSSKQNELPVSPEILNLSDELMPKETVKIFLIMQRSS